MFWILLLTATLAQTNWPQFRGPGSAGLADNPRLPDRWSETENVAWKTDIPGLGWSSPIIWGDRVFVTSVVPMVDQEKPRIGIYLDGRRTTPPPGEHRWMVYCIDFKTGKIRWEREVHRGEPKSAHHLKNSFASETPVTDGERVYAYFGNVGVFAFDVDGKPLWSHPIGPFPHARRLGYRRFTCPPQGPPLHRLRQRREVVHGRLRCQDRRGGLARGPRREEQLGHAACLGARRDDGDRDQRLGAHPVLRCRREVAVGTGRGELDCHPDAALAVWHGLCFLGVRPGRKSAGVCGAARGDRRLVSSPGRTLQYLADHLRRLLLHAVRPWVSDAVTTPGPARRSTARSGSIRRQVPLRLPRGPTTARSSC